MFKKISKPLLYIHYLLSILAEACMSVGVQMSLIDIFFLLLVMFIWHVQITHLGLFGIPKHTNLLSMVF